MEIIPGIHWLSIITRTLPPHRATNTYLLISDCTILAIDAIQSEEPELKRYFSELGLDSITMAAITHPHPDHYRGLDTLLDQFGGEIITHSLARNRLEEVFTERTFGQEINGGEVLQIGKFQVSILHTPGHSPHHICLYLKDEKVLFSGDTILGWGTSIIAPPEGDMIAYMKTLLDLSEIEVDVICPGHGPVIKERAAEKIQWYYVHRLMRERKVLDALKAGPLTPSEIAEKIYNEEDFKMHGRDLLPRAVYSVMAHIQKLEKEGLVTILDESDSSKYCLT